MKKISLNGRWTLGMEEWRGEAIEAEVPGEVHLDLIRAGKMEEPLYGTNAKKCQWVEEKEWWYRKEFEVEEKLLLDYAELVFEGIDTNCEVYLNQEKIAEHNNMFIPLTINITGKLRKKNTLEVKVDSGINHIKDKPIYPYPAGSNEQDYRRVWLRKAQFTFAWDWAPRLINVGIWRGVYLQFFEKAALRNVFIQNEISQSFCSAEIKISGIVKNFNESFNQEFRGRLRAQLYDQEGKMVACVENSLPVYPGINKFQVMLKLENPHLWWPNGVGDPYLYYLTLSLLDEGGKELDSFKKRFGIRKISLKQELFPISDNEGESFIININGEDIFCKGANWVPADSIIARVSKEKYKKLIDEAAEANFNMFRVWGGGIYEDPFFYEYCSEKGIMIWQDFMFACAYYPNDPNFLKEIEKEIKEVVINLRNETCIVLWCGNNELQWLHIRNLEKCPDSNLSFIDYPIYHEIIPSILIDLDQSRPYWFSSPYGGADPNSEWEGNRHSWDVSINSPDLLDRINYSSYARDHGKFISEFGVLAPPSLETLKNCIPPEELYVGSTVWDFHNNIFEQTNIQGMLREFYRDPQDLSLEEYVKYSQLLQAEALKFGLDHWRRRKFRTAGALFWMYSDCWGAIGWTVIDYYLRKKPSYYYVRQAFKPLKVSLRLADEFVSIYVVNDTLHPFSGILEYGISFFSGEEIVQESIPVEIIPNTSQKIREIKLPQNAEVRKSAFCWAKLLSEGNQLDRDRLFLVRFKDLNLPKAQVSFQLKRIDQSNVQIELCSTGFAWFVDLSTSLSENDFSDNYFDIFPMENIKVKWSGHLPDPLDLKVSWNNQ